jgi:probable phosphoglycerate mutase
VKGRKIVCSLLVLRHGQSLWNLQERWQGRADIPLSDEGVRQALDAATNLGTFDLVASSQLERARHTATIIAEHLGIGPVEVDERLQETHVGPWEGLTRGEIEERWPGYLQGRLKPEGFEQDEDIVTRMTSAFTEIGARCESGSALIVSHSGVIRTMRYMMNVSNPRLPNLGGSWFHLRHDGSIEAGEVVSVLEQSTSPDSL